MMTCLLIQCLSSALNRCQCLQLRVAVSVRSSGIQCVAEHMTFDRTHLSKCDGSYVQPHQYRLQTFMKCLEHVPEQRAENVRWNFALASYNMTISPLLLLHSGTLAWHCEA